jgi:hypothetical protein
MSNLRSVFVFRVVVSLLLAVLGSAVAGTNAHPVPPTSAAEEQAVWDLEHAYWHDVEVNDLAAYRGLWHPNFLGWPRMNSTPLGKDHITDWITSQTAKGLTFKLIEFKPAALRITDDRTAVACYWVTSKWVDRAGAGDSDTARIIHTWIKNGKTWQIIGGMSMTETR